MYIFKVLTVRCGNTEDDSLLVIGFVFVARLRLSSCAFFDAVAKR
jgi:hypothetical protein